jgi:hypothetical protein
VREGDQVRGYYSFDNNTWQPLSDAVTLTDLGTPLVGFAGTSWVGASDYYVRMEFAGPPAVQAVLPGTIDEDNPDL